MATAMEIVLEFFHQNEWKFDLDEENHRVRSGINGDNGEWSFSINVLEEKGLCTIMGSFPQRSPEKQRRQCAELLMRINCDLAVSSFEINLDTGDIRLVTYYPFPEGQMDAAVFRSAMGHNISIMDRFIPAIMSVIYAGTTPKKALAKVKQAREKEEKRKARKPRLGGRFLPN